MKRAIAAILWLGLSIPSLAAAQETEVDLGVESPPEGDSTGEEAAPEGGEAAPDPVERARELFGLGVACVETRDFACAERNFREALALRDAPAVRYNLASALYELGRYPEAARLTRSVLSDPETPETVAGPTRVLESQLAENAGILEVVVSGAPSDAELRIDGEAVPREQWSAVEVAPGARRLSLISAEATLAERTVEPEAGQQLRVELTVVPSPEDVAADADLGEEPSGEEPPLVEDWRFWAAVGAGVVVVTIVVIVVAATVSGGTQDPIVGDYEPGVLRW